MPIRNRAVADTVVSDSALIASLRSAVVSPSEVCHASGTSFEPSLRACPHSTTNDAITPSASRAPVRAHQRRPLRLSTYRFLTSGLLNTCDRRNNACHGHLERATNACSWPVRNFPETCGQHPGLSRVLCRRTNSARGRRWCLRLLCTSTSAPTLPVWWSSIPHCRRGREVSVRKNPIERNARPGFTLRVMRLRASACAILELLFCRRHADSLEGRAKNADS